MNNLQHCRWFKVLLFFLVFCIYSLKAFALPIDWNGRFGLDLNLIDNYNRMAEETTGNRANGSQEPAYLAGSDDNGSFESYIFSLNPVIIINDAATFKAEFSNGYARGGRLGDSSIKSGHANNSFGNALHFIDSTSTQNSSFGLNKLYMELYTDTATFVLGRHTSHWALGAVINSGEKLWDRFSYTRDGVTMKIKLGKFSIYPYWAKMGAGTSLTKATKVEEYGFSLLYDDTDRDMVLGLLYSFRESGPGATGVQSVIADPNGSNAVDLGETETKLIDLYFKKAFGNLELALEFPIASGKLGDLYQEAGNVSYKGKAFIFESNYKFNESILVGLNFGQVNGDSGASSSYDAMFLHPNYKIATIMFNYNMNGFANQNTSVFDSYITNARYIKVYGHWITGNWTWKGAFIYAQALEAAKANSLAYNHSTNVRFSALEDQEKDLGFEFDLGFDYKWNEQISTGGSFGYHVVGDYFAFNNDPAVNPAAKNTLAIQLRAGIHF
ncbi:MAG: hypothetical protein ISR65_04540 [Bacteriovoracaceae bacterium]|nr:hypothetical protein [Bacteriovoracaceae bacterium]